jgi:lysophospholipase L1-like esterase
VETIRYVALGDSYTIGTGVSERERWPNQLVARLSGSVELELTANLGVSGYTSGDLIDYELPRVAALRPNFVTALIGVNDVVQRVPESTYHRNVAAILDTLLSNVAPEHIVVVSTPDYTRTPHGADFGDPIRQRAQTANFNDVMAKAAAARAIRYVDIGPIADQAATDRSLVARDGLHPSGVQYSRWVDLIAPVVSKALGVSRPG